MAYFLQVLASVLAIRFGVEIYSSNVTSTNYEQVYNTSITISHIQIKDVSVIACCSQCNIYNWCNCLSYNPASQECQLSNVSIEDVGTHSENSSDWITFVSTDTACTNLLVNGVGGVEDSQLTASSHYCSSDGGKCHSTNTPDGMSAKYSRLNSTGYQRDAWAPLWRAADQYVQVEFYHVETIAAILLLGRPEHIQYVTGFKVLTSLDCSNFSYITESGVETIFQGNSNPAYLVTRYLGERVRTKCLRINPVQWEDWPALRFDVLGC